MEKDFSSLELIHKKSGNIEYLQFKILNKYEDKIKHMITLRHGGVSLSPCDTLNFRTLGNDKKENVFENLKRACNALKIDYKKVYKGRQAHTDNVIVISNENKEEYNFFNLSNEEVDGYICNEKDIATLVTTADCNPIIIYDPVKNVYANIHSGWKGTVKRIYLKAAIFLHEKFDSNYEDMIVCVGPSIKKCCFSSEEESFKKIFTDIWKNEEEYIYYEKENNKRFHIDLGKVISCDLVNLGIKNENIVIPDICTMCNKDSFFSYRDACMKKEADYGTMATIVSIV